MKLKNNVARIITIEHVVKDRLERFSFLPAGPAVEVPDGLSSSRYGKALIGDGSLSIVSGGDSLPDDDLSDLVSQAEELGISVDKRWGKQRLSDEIEKALEK